MKPNIIQKPAAIGNYAIGRVRSIDRITFHHIVGDAPAAIARFQKAGEAVSAHYVIGSDGTIYQCVGHANTAWCDGSADSNARTISIEHAGGIASVPYTDAMYAASAELVRYLIATYGINDSQRHRDVIDKAVYQGGTACPGELDVERIVKQAKGEDMKVGAELAEKAIRAVVGKAWAEKKIQEEAAYWAKMETSGPTLNDFADYLWNLSNSYILAAQQQITDLHAEIAKLQSDKLADKLKRVQAIINE